MYVVIVNPVAGNGKGKKLYERIRHSPFFKDNTVFYIAEYKGHIHKIMTKLEHTHRNIQVLFVVGGDGTMHEVINALSNKQLRVAYIPGGSGNDFARGINSLKDPDSIIKQAITEQKEATYWLCTFETGPSHQESFINCIGFGFDAIVGHSASKLSLRNMLSKLRLNSLVYIFALLRELFFYQPLQMTMTIDGEKQTFDQVLFLTINNQPYMGGGMKVNPQAHNNDTDFSIIVIDSISKWKVFLLFGTVFFGKHTRFKEVHIFQAQEVTISATSASYQLPFQVDGEYGETNTATIRKLREPIYVKGIKA